MIDSIKDLNKIMALCRKNGVKSIKIAGIEFTMDDSALAPLNKPAKRQPIQNIPGLPESYLPGMAEANGHIETNIPSAEDLLFYSATQPGGQQ